MTVGATHNAAGWEVWQITRDGFTAQLLHETLIELEREVERRHAEAEAMSPAVREVLPPAWPVIAVCLGDPRRTVRRLAHHWNLIRPAGGPALSPAIAALSEIRVTGRAAEVYLGMQHAVPYPVGPVELTGTETLDHDGRPRRPVRLTTPEDRRREAQDFARVGRRMMRQSQRGRRRAGWLAGCRRFPW